MPSTILGGNTMDTPLILTPDQMRMNEFKTQVNELSKKYGMQLIPVVQIVGNQITSAVEAVPAQPSADQENVPNNVPPNEAA